MAWCTQLIPERMLPLYSRSRMAFCPGLPRGLASSSLDCANPSESSCRAIYTQISHDIMYTRALGWKLLFQKLPGRGI